MFDNWKKIERLTKHHKSESHQTAMAKWIDSRANKKKNTLILSETPGITQTICEGKSQLL